MPHRENVTWAAWIEALSEQDPCLGRIVKEAVVDQDAALHAGARSAGSPRAPTGRGSEPPTPSANSQFLLRRGSPALRSGEEAPPSR